MAHVAGTAGAALLTLAGGAYLAWLKWGPTVKAGFALLQDCKKRLDLHDDHSGFDSAAKAAIAVDPTSQSTTAPKPK